MTVIDPRLITNLTAQEYFVSTVPEYSKTFGCPDVTSAAKFCTSYFSSYFSNLKLFGILIVLASILMIAFEWKARKNRQILAQNKELFLKLKEQGIQGTPNKSIFEMMDDWNKPKNPGGGKA